MSKNIKAKKKKSFIERNKTRIFTALFSIIAVLILAVIICIGIYNKKLASVKLPFVPPEFDENAVEGNPAALGIGQNEGYTVMGEEQQLAYRAGFCGLFDVKVDVIDETDVYSADVYFYNPPTNSIYIKFRVYGKDPKKDIVAETGLIKPGEYIKTLTFNRKIVNGEKLTIKVMSYVPEDYTSAGTFNLNPMVISPIKSKGINIAQMVGCTSSLGASGIMFAISIMACIPLAVRKKKK